MPDKYFIGCLPLESKEVVAKEPGGHFVIFSELPKQPAQYAKRNAPASRTSVDWAGHVERFGTAGNSQAGPASQARPGTNVSAGLAGSEKKKNNLFFCVVFFG